MQVSLSLYTHGHFFVHYMAFLDARPNMDTCAHKYQHVVAAKKVIELLLASSSESMTHLQTYMTWLERLGKQVKSYIWHHAHGLLVAVSMPLMRCCGVIVMQLLANQPYSRKLDISVYPKMTQLIAMQERLMHQADQVIFQNRREYNNRLSLSGAVAARDKALMALMFGYIPPMRLRVLKTLKHPE